MKMMKLVYPMTLALAVTLAATGCRNHRPVGVTPIPNGTGGLVNNPGPGDTMGNNRQPGNIAQADINSFDNMTQDRTALANYTVHFAFDSSTIRHSEDANLQSVASRLSSDPSTKLIIEGNCDERGTEEYNRSLGDRRALAAREALAKMGVDPARVRTMSYGKDKPVDPGHNESAWSQNRRDDFVLLHPRTGA
ncbi:MAG: OmpA family protein [Limisphaerales bacterium]